MKKSLTLISAILVLMMVLSVSTFAAETDPKLASLEQTVVYTGPSFTATEAMTVDGRLEEAEGWVCITPDNTNRTTLAEEYRFNAWKENSKVAIGEDQTAFASNFKFYVAQTETDVYFAIEDFAPYFEVDGEEGFTKASESLCRNNYNIRLGFDAANYDRYIHIREFNSLDQLNICGPDGYKSMKSVYGDLVTYTFARFAEDGTHLYDGNKNTTNQHYWVKPAVQWTGRLEIKLSKAMIKEMYVEQFGEGADAKIDFTTMFVSVSAGGFIPDPAESNKGTWVYTLYGGTMLTPEVATEKSLTERVVPTHVVFGKDPSITEAPTTEAPTDAPATEAPAGEPTGASSEDITDLPEGGCGSSVTLAGVALVAALGTCTAFAAKKKED